MPNYKIKVKANKRIQDVVITASDPENASQLVLSKFPTGVVLSIEQKGPGNEGPAPAVTVNRSSGMKKLVLLIIILALAAGGYMLLKSMGKI